MNYETLVRGTMVRSHLATLRDHQSPFQLTRAIRPAFENGIIPREGYHRTMYNNGRRFSLVVAISAERLWDIFWDLFQTLLGKQFTLDLAIISDLKAESEPDLFFSRSWLTRAMVRPSLVACQELLLHDGSLGLILHDAKSSLELSCDKNIIAVGSKGRIARLEGILARRDIPRRDHVALLCHGAHEHRTSSAFRHSQQKLIADLGLEQWYPEDECF